MSRRKRFSFEEIILVRDIIKMNVEFREKSSVKNFKKLKEWKMTTELEIKSGKNVEEDVKPRWQKDCF